MKKTFIIGFLGLILVGGFLTGIYLINQQTNPSSSAQEIVRPLSEPTSSPTEEEATRVFCEKYFGKKTGDLDFKAICDVNKDGLINILDLSKLE